MTMKERTVWAQLFVFPLAAIVFLALTLPQLSDGPAEAVSWVVPMIWCMGAVVVGIIAVTIAMAIATGIRVEARGDKVEFDEGDSRDDEFEVHGKARSVTVLGFVGLAVIILAMVDAAPYWIATTMFVGSALASIYASAIQLRAYRTGL